MSSRIPGEHLILCLRNPSYQPGPSVRPATKVSELDVVPDGFAGLLPEGPLLEAEFFFTPGPPFSPVTPLELEVLLAGVCADTPLAFWHAPLASKL